MVSGAGPVLRTLSYIGHCATSWGSLRVAHCGSRSILLLSRSFPPIFHARAAHPVPQAKAVRTAAHQLSRSVAYHIITHAPLQPFGFRRVRDITGQSFLVLVRGRPKVVIECGMILKEFNRKRKVLCLLSVGCEANRRHCAGQLASGPLVVGGLAGQARHKSACRRDSSAKRLESERM